MRRLGFSLSALRLLQALAGTGTAVLAALLARLLGGTRAALAAGLLTAFYLPLVALEGQVLKTTFEVLLATAATLASASLVARGSGRPLAWFATGLLSGLAVLFKANFLAAVPVLAAAAATSQARPGAMRRAGAAVALALGLVPPLALVARDNHRAGAEPLVLPWSSGINFWIGNGPHANGVDPTLGFAHAAPEEEAEAGRREAERRAGRPLSPAASSRFWWGETLRAIRADPARWLKLLAVKLRVFLHRYEYTDNLSLYFLAERVPVLGLPLAGWWLALPLGLAGLFGLSVAPRPPAALLVAGTLAAQAASVVLFHVSDRYRLALVPGLFALGCAALTGLRHAPRPGRAAVLAGLAAGFALSGLPPSPVAPHGQNLGSHHEMVGTAALRDGDAATAERELRRALELDPTLPVVRFNLAAALRERRHFEQAERMVREGLERLPDHPGGSFLLAQLLLARGAWAEAAEAFARCGERGIDAPVAWFGAALALHRAGRDDEARGALARSLDLEPDDPASLALLGDIELARGDLPAARSAWERSLAVRPDADLARKLGALAAP